jgi:hypothetical protein
MLSKDVFIASLLNDDAGCIQYQVWLPKRCDDTIAARSRRAEVYKQNLVFPMIDDLSKLRSQRYQIRSRQPAFKGG